MTDLLLSKRERDSLFRRIETLQSELNAARQAEHWYRDELRRVSKRIIEIHNAVGAKSTLPEQGNETVSQAWDRCFDEIFEAIE